jgi:hypothetical protein
MMHLNIYRTLFPLFTTCFNTKLFYVHPLQLMFLLREYQYHNLRSSYFILINIVYKVINNENDKKFCNEHLRIYA